MKDFSKLKKATDQFFELHWSKLHGAKPEWWHWNLVDEFANPTSGGCYAVFKGDRLLYVGLALTPGSTSTHRDPTVGLYKRLRRHVVDRLKGSSIHTCKSKRLADMTHVEAIAFPSEARYMAAALEAFLIWNLEPPKNYPFSRRLANDA